MLGDDPKDQMQGRRIWEMQMLGESWQIIPGTMPHLGEMLNVRCLCRKMVSIGNYYMPLI